LETCRSSRRPNPSVGSDSIIDGSGPHELAVRHLERPSALLAPLVLCSEPQAKIAGFEQVELKVTLGFGKELKTNGHITAVEVMSVKAGK
jgi:hypothetical protein